MADGRVPLPVAFGMLGDANPAVTHRFYGRHRPTHRKAADRIYGARG